jgi:type II secretory pathway component PulL
MYSPQPSAEQNVRCLGGLVRFGQNNSKKAKPNRATILCTATACKYTFVTRRCRGSSAALFTTGLTEEKTNGLRVRVQSKRRWRKQMDGWRVVALFPWPCRTVASALLVS